jgi:hypothetical protein
MYLLRGERYQSFFPAETMKFPLKTENNAKNCGLWRQRRTERQRKTPLSRAICSLIKHSDPYQMVCVDGSQPNATMRLRQRTQPAEGPGTPPPMSQVRRDVPIHFAQQAASNPSPQSHTLTRQRPGHEGLAAAVKCQRLQSGSWTAVLRVDWTETSAAFASAACIGQGSCPL